MAVHISNGICHFLWQWTLFDNVQILGQLLQIARSDDDSVTKLVVYGAVVDRPTECCSMTRDAMALSRCGSLLESFFELRLSVPVAVELTYTDLCQEARC